MGKSLLISYFLCLSSSNRPLGVRQRTTATTSLSTIRVPGAAPASKPAGQPASQGALLLSSPATAKSSHCPPPRGHTRLPSVAFWNSTQLLEARIWQSVRLRQNCQTQRRALPATLLHTLRRQTRTSRTTNRSISEAVAKIQSENSSRISAQDPAKPPAKWGLRRNC